MIVVYSDTNGFVLCNKDDNILFSDWCNISDKKLYYHKFTEFYDKYDGDKQIITKSIPKLEPTVNHTNQGENA